VKRLLARNDHNIFLSDADGRTPMWHAAETEQTEVAQLLVAHQAKSDPKKEHLIQGDLRGSTPLFMAARSGVLGVVKALLILPEKFNIAKMQAKEFDYQTTALFTATSRGHSNVVEVLLDTERHLNVRIDHSNKYGQTPLKLVIKNGTTT
jgi:ankyrin repeat protein